jgi:hypothetical protein
MGLFSEIVHYLTEGTKPDADSVARLKAAAAKADGDAPKAESEPSQEG